MRALDGQPITSFPDACLVVQTLSGHFQIPAPEMWRGTAKTSFYRTGHEQIVLSAADWHGLTMATLHEFAHHLAKHRCGVRIRHERPFYELLKDVIRAYGLPLDAYPWHTEYQCIWQWASWERLTARAWFLTEKRAERRREAIAAGNDPDRWAPGMRVEFVARREGALRGRVSIVRRGCRVRVALDDGRTAMVPPTQLREVTS